MPDPKKSLYKIVVSRLPYIVEKDWRRISNLILSAVTRTVTVEIMYVLFESYLLEDLAQEILLVLVESPGLDHKELARAVNRASYRFLRKYGWARVSSSVNNKMPWMSREVYEDTIEEN